MTTNITMTKKPSGKFTSATIEINDKDTYHLLASTITNKLVLIDNIIQKVESENVKKMYQAKYETLESIYKMFNNPVNVTKL